MEPENPSLFGMPVYTTESIDKDEFWMVSDRGAKAIKDYDEGAISKDDRDAILGEELLYNRAAFGRINA